MASSSGKKIILKSFDGHTFEVDQAIVLESQTLKFMIEDCAGDEIPIPIVAGTILAKIIEYCKKHFEASDDKPSADDLKKWDEDFIKVDQATLYDLLLAANYLEIKSLLDLACQAVANMIKDKTPEEIRKIFNIVNDLSPEEQEEVRRENAWALD